MVMVAENPGGPTNKARPKESPGEGEGERHTKKRNTTPLKEGKTWKWYDKKGIWSQLRVLTQGEKKIIQGPTMYRRPGDSRLPDLGENGGVPGQWVGLHQIFFCA